MKQKTPTNRMCNFGGYISALQKVGFTLIVSLWGSLGLAAESWVYRGLNVGFWSQSAKANDHREGRHGVRMLLYLFLLWQKSSLSVPPLYQLCYRELRGGRKGVTTLSGQCYHQKTAEREENFRRVGDGLTVRTRILLQLPSLENGGKGLLGCHFRIEFY